MAEKRGHVKRRNTYTVFEDAAIRWHWDLNDIYKFDEMADEGYTLGEIAGHFRISFDETVLLACDRIRRGKIKKGLRVTLV